MGLQLSGIDVLMYVLKYYGTLRSLIVVCNLEFITSRKSIKSLWERGAFVHKERMTEYAGGKRVAFSDGDVREVDTLYFCTGYEYSFPFWRRARSRDTEREITRRAWVLSICGLCPSRSLDSFSWG